MSRLPVAELPSTCVSKGHGRLKLMASGVISAASDANLILVLIVFTALCLLAFNVNVVAPEATPAVRQFGPYP
jgi:hypothetical protein